MLKPVLGKLFNAKWPIFVRIGAKGLDAVDGGSLHQSWRQQPSTPSSYLANMPAADLKQQLASLGTERTPEQHQQFLANHAAQEKDLQAKGVVLKK